MNVIGHLACARSLPERARLGALLPDVLTIYNRRCKVLPLLKKWEHATIDHPPIGEIIDGIRFHLQVDVRFHKLPLFTLGFRGIRDTLSKAGNTPGLKRILPAHVLIELFLDHLLLLEYPHLEGEFYRLLDHHRGAIEELCEEHPKFDSGRFGEFLNRILGGGFLDEYFSIDGLIPRMNRIQSNLGQRPLELGEAAALRDYLTEQVPQVRPALLQFVSAMSDKASLKVAGKANPESSGAADNRASNNS